MKGWVSGPGFGSLTLQRDRRRPADDCSPPNSATTPRSPRKREIAERRIGPSAETETPHHAAQPQRVLRSKASWELVSAISLSSVIYHENRPPHLGGRSDCKENRPQMHAESITYLRASVLEKILLCRAGAFVRRRITAIFFHCGAGAAAGQLRAKVLFLPAYRISRYTHAKPAHLHKPATWPLRP
jgi:hypothetical protein